MVRCVAEYQQSRLWDEPDSPGQRAPRRGATRRDRVVDAPPPPSLFALDPPPAAPAASEAAVSPEAVAAPASEAAVSPEAVAAPASEAAVSPEAVAAPASDQPGRTSDQPGSIPRSVARPAPSAPAGAPEP